MRETKQKNDGYIRWRCPNCGKKLKMPADHEGGFVAQCPKCLATINVPMANLQALQDGADLEGTGVEEWLKVNPDLVMKRLRGEDEDETAVGRGGPVANWAEKAGTWSPTAFSRVAELDQVSASIALIDDEIMGQVQRLYRMRDLSRAQREERAKEIAQMRRRKLRKLFRDKLEPMKRRARVLQQHEDSLGPRDLHELAELRRKFEAVLFYGRVILRVRV